MAKKRKLRSSEPETSKAPEPQPQEQQQPPPLQTEVAGDEGDGLNHQQMAVDDSNQGEPEQQQDDEQNQSETLDAAAPQNGGVSVEANGGGNEEQEEEEDEEEDEEDEDEEEEEEEEEEKDDEEPVEKLLEPFSREQLLSLVRQAAEKYPDFISNIRDLAEADPAHRKIFVHGLGWDTTAETLISEFVKYGEIEDCKAVTDRVSGKSKGYAFILFKRRSGARKALKQPQKKIGNRITSSQLASAGPVPAPPPVAAPVSEYTLRKIFVSNVSTEVEPAKLLEFFRQFGEIEEGPLGLDRQTGKPKGFALFVYKSVESAKKALEEPHKSFEGLTLHCQKAIDGPKVNKPYHHHQQQHHHHHHHQHHQPQQQFHSRKDKNKYSAGPGHLMAPSGPAPAAMGFNPGVPAGAGGPPPLNPVLGQALTALLTTQGAGLGIGNLLGGLSGAPVNQAGPPAGYGNQAAGGYGNQPGMQGGYQNPQMGQSGARPHGPGAHYMGH